MSPFSEVRALTKLALPADDAYLFRLGVAHYGFCSVHSFMTEIVTHLDSSADRIALLDKYPSETVKLFDKAAKGWGGASIQPYASTAAEEFVLLNDERNDFIHTYPITGTSGAQILHRRKDSHQKYFEVTESFLDSFIARLSNVNSALSTIGSIVRPDLERPNRRVGKR